MNPRTRSALTIHPASFLSKLDFSTQACASLVLKRGVVSGSNECKPLFLLYSLKLRDQEPAIYPEENLGSSKYPSYLIPFNPSPDRPALCQSVFSEGVPLLSHLLTHTPHTLLQDVKSLYLFIPDLKYHSLKKVMRLTPGALLTPM